MSHAPFSPGASSPPPAGDPTTPFLIPYSQKVFQYSSKRWAAWRSSSESDAGWTSIMLRTGPIRGSWGSLSAPSTHRRGRTKVLWRTRQSLALTIATAQSPPMKTQ